MEEEIKKGKGLPEQSGQESNPDSAKPKKEKKSSALRAAGQWRSAVGHVRAHAHRDVEGSSGLSNTGPYIDYDED